MKISQARTIKDLQALGIGRVLYDVGGRGGNVGFYGSDVARFVGVQDSDLPNKFGAYCNYLGGGVRGAVCGSGYNQKVSKRAAAKLEAIQEACKRAYINAEGGLNDDYEDGSTNWDAAATKAARAAGVESAY